MEVRKHGKKSAWEGGYTIIMRWEGGVQKKKNRYIAKREKKK